MINITNSASRVYFIYPDNIYTHSVKIEQILIAKWAIHAITIIKMIYLFSMGSFNSNHQELPISSIMADKIRWKPIPKHSLIKRNPKSQSPINLDKNSIHKQIIRTIKC